MSSIDRQTLRNEILRHFNEQPSTQLGNVAHCIDQRLGEGVRNRYRKEIFEEIHLLLLNNIIMIGHNYGQWEHPWLELTEHGKKCIREGVIVPLDPDGYISQITKELPALDPIVLDYLKESISSFNRDLILSSTITLGVASEQVMLLLIESFANYVADTKPSVKERLMGEDSIFKKYKFFKESFLQLPKDIKTHFPQNFDVHIDTLFNFIRLNRNEAGHPLGGGRDKNVQAANLQAFKSYLVEIYNLMDYFIRNKKQ